MIGIEFVIYLWYAFSHKFILNYTSKEIIENACGGIVNKKINVDDIREYYVREDNPDYIGGKSKNKIVTRISLKLNSGTREILKDVQWNISPEDARNLFSEATKINSNIICSDVSFYESPLSKRRQTKFLILACVIMLVAFFAFFFYIFNNMNSGAPMPSAEDNNKELNAILKDYNTRNGR
jgi:hypothetical protein